MAVVITPKKGDSDPTTDDLADGEIAIRKDVNPPKLFVRVGSNIREIGAGEANQSLTTGNGLTGANSGDSGDFTIAVGAGTGIDVAADAISVDVSDFMTNGSDNRVVTATGTDAMNAEANLTFDGSTLDLSGTLNTDSNILVAGYVGRDGDNYINFGTDNQITFRVSAGNNVVMKASGEIEASSLDISGDIDIDGTSNLDNTDIDGTLDVSGIVSIASEINHTGDTDNSIAFGTDTQTFETSGSTRLDLSDSGLRIGGSGARVTTIEDNDSLGTSDTKLATQGNVKAYVDANAGGISGLGSTDNAILRANGTGGSTAQGSGITVDDSNNMLIPTDADIRFRDSAISINSSADQYLDINSDRFVRVNVDNSDSNGAFIIMDSTESSPTQKIYMYPDDNPYIQLASLGGTYGRLGSDEDLYLTASDDVRIGGVSGTGLGDNVHINVGDGDVLTLEEADTVRMTFNLDSTPEVDATGDFTIDCSADIILDADGSQIYFKDDTTERFRFNLDSTPKMDVTGAFTIDCTDDIILDAGGEDITFKDAGNTRIHFDLDSSPTMDVTGAFDIKSSTSITLDAAQDIILSADGNQISMDDGSTTRFTFNVDSTPEIDVTGDFKIDCSSTIELDATGGTMLTEASDSSATGTLMRPVAFAQDSSILMGGSIQYYPSSTDTITVSRSTSAINNVLFLPFNTHGTMASGDEPEHYFYAPANGHFIAITAVSNNPLFKDPGTGNFWQSKIQIFEATGTGGGSNKFGTIDGDETVLAAAEDSNLNEITGAEIENSNTQKVIYNFSQQGTFRFTAGKIYAFGFRQDKMGGVDGTSNSTKSHTIHLNYILSYDETTSGSGYGGWTGL